MLDINRRSSVGFPKILGTIVVFNSQNQVTKPFVSAVHASEQYRLASNYSLTWLWLDGFWELSLDDKFEVYRLPLRLHIYDYVLPLLEKCDAFGFCSRITFFRRRGRPHGARHKFYRDVHYRNKALIAITEVNQLIRAESLPVLCRKISLRFTAEHVQKVEILCKPLVASHLFQSVKLVNCDVTRLCHLDFSNMPRLEMLVIRLVSSNGMPYNILKKTSTKQYRSLWNDYTNSKQIGASIIRSLVGKSFRKFSLVMWVNITQDDQSKVRSISFQNFIHNQREHILSGSSHIGEPFWTDFFQEE